LRISDLLIQKNVINNLISHSGASWVHIQVLHLLLFWCSRFREIESVSCTRRWDHRSALVLSPNRIGFVNTFLMKLIWGIRWRDWVQWSIFTLPVSKLIWGTKWRDWVQWFVSPLHHKFLMPCVILYIIHYLPHWTEIIFPIFCLSIVAYKHGTIIISNRNYVL
jgi:hypothetical protein